MDDITKKWEKLSLTDVEGNECALIDGDDSFALVAKFLTVRNTGRLYCIS